MIKDYFILYYKTVKRSIADFGLHPLTGFLLAVTIFYGLSVYLFNITPYASYLYVFAAIAFMLPLCEKDRNDFLSIIFRKKEYRLIRMFENVLRAIPFLPLLLWNHHFAEVIILIILALFISFYRTSSSGSHSIPTPFYRKPYEFISNFRLLLVFFAGCYILAVISILNFNFNLAVFTLLLTHILCISSYNEPENEFYVWVFKKNPRSFLLEKIKTGVVHSQILTVPLLILLSIFFNDHIILLLGFQLLGACYLINMIAAKYAAWPGKLNLPQVLLFAGGLAFPPLLFITTPYFIIQSQKKLNSILA